MTSYPAKKLNKIKIKGIQISTIYQPSKKILTILKISFCIEVSLTKLRLVYVRRFKNYTAHRNCYSFLIYTKNNKYYTLKIESSK